MRVHGLESLWSEHTAAAAAAAGSSPYGKNNTFKVNKTRRLAVNFCLVK
jgi:hypothetical protein